MLLAVGGWEATVSELLDSSELVKASVPDTTSSANRRLRSQG